VKLDPGKIASVWRSISAPGAGGPRFQVEVSFEQAGAGGTVVTLFHADEPIGRGVVGVDGRVTIVPEKVTDTNDLVVRFQQEGALPAQDGVTRGTPAQPTTLTLTGPGKFRFDTPTTFTGHLDPALPSAPIVVVYTRDSNGETITHDATTDASGNYTDTVSIPRAKAGQWHAQAFYSGDTDHGASSSAVLQLTVGA
jgi:hypothetical protein